MRQDRQAHRRAARRFGDLLKDTLIINHKGYTTWMAGGGVRGGLSYGETDEHGCEAVAGKVHIHDWHATILHLLGLDHERLTFRHAGREMRLTEVRGNVVKDILA